MTAAPDAQAAARVPSIAEAAAAIATRALSPVDLVEACLARIEALNPSLHPFVAVTAEAARADAREAEAEIAAGRYRGPLHGIPLALKDAFDTAELRTTVGSRLHLDRVPASDAASWARLKAAGAILVGKLELTEFCLGGPADDGAFPHSRNPHDPGRYAGGSSSGAAVAIAAGMIPGALGSDTGGSIRLPAAFCGITGLKPTYGLVSRRGVFPLSPSLDHVGPMAATARDCALMLQAIAGPDPGDPTSADPGPLPDYAAALTGDLAGLTVGWGRNHAGADRAVADDQRAVAEAALEVLAARGATVVPVDLPDLWDFTACNSTIMMSEAYAIHERDLTTRGADYCAFTRDRIGLGAFLRGVDYIQAQRRRRELVAEWRAATAHVDAVVTPGALGTAPKLESVSKFYFLQVPLMTCPSNSTGDPSIAVPAGTGADGMPLAIQITGRPFDEATVLRIADAFQQERGATP